MLNQKARTGLLALTLAGSLAVPAAAADAQSATQTTDLLTRGELLTMLYKQEGKPAVNYAMDYSDVDGARTDAEAIRWLLVPALPVDTAMPVRPRRPGDPGADGGDSVPVRPEP